MQNYEYILIAITISTPILVFLLYYFQKKNQPDQKALAMMLDYMKQLRMETENSRQGQERTLQEHNRQLSQRLDTTAKFIIDLQNKLADVSNIGHHIKKLSDIMISPKTRGNFGEEMLQQIISQVLPRSGYVMQYKFNSGDVVDCAVMVSQKILPIDSKFSLENFLNFQGSMDDAVASEARRYFLRDVKKRIDEIGKKYILPQENTFDFALMYVPSEAIFMEIIEEPSLLEYARSKKVYIVSPNTLYHHLQIVLLSLKGERVNTMAAEIIKHLSSLKVASEKIGKNMNLMISHNRNAQNAQSAMIADYDRFNQMLDQIVRFPDEKE